MDDKTRLETAVALTSAIIRAGLFPVNRASDPARTAEYATDLLQHILKDLNAVSLAD